VVILTTRNYYINIGLDASSGNASRIINPPANANKAENIERTCRVFSGMHEFVLGKST
jgi:hypothetical protein